MGGAQGVIRTVQLKCYGVHAPNTPFVVMSIEGRVLDENTSPERG